ncbi:hypothetical protein ACFQX8_09775 [Klenkia terrae]|uniref:hypothetical protein n=1 Tax=Klenkia terrae TaxID=1052259 RepID=UPI0036065194
MWTPAPWSPRRTTRRRGTPLWALLLVLVLLPVAGLTTFAVVLAGRASAAADASASAAVQVHAFGRLAQASAAVDQELLVLVVAAALDDPVVVARLGITPEFGAAVAGTVLTAADRVRAATDEQLAAARAVPASAAAAEAAQAEVAELRAEVDGGTTPSSPSCGPTGPPSRTACTTGRTPSWSPPPARGRPPPPSPPSGTCAWSPTWPPR